MDQIFNKEVSWTYEDAWNDFLEGGIKQFTERLGEDKLKELLKRVGD